MKTPIEPDRTLVGMPSLHALKAFVAAAKYENFTRASEALCVTQAAISRQIRELEDTLGVDLFSRSGRAIKLTKAGHMLFDATYLSFVNIAQAAERIKTDTMQSRELRICASPAFSSIWLAPRLPQFFAQHPEININILKTDEFSAFETNTKPDVLINMNPAYGRAYQSIHLFNERIYPVCSPQYVEMHPDIRSLDGLKKSVLLELSPFRMAQIYEHLDWSFWFYLAGHPGPQQPIGTKQLFRANDYNVILKMALQHQGVALGWNHLVEALIKDGKLIRPVEHEVVLSEKSHYLYYDANLTADERFIAFKNWLLSYF